MGCTQSTVDHPSVIPPTSTVHKKDATTRSSPTQAMSTPSDGGGRVSAAQRSATFFWSLVLGLSLLKQLNVYNTVIECECECEAHLGLLLQVVSEL